MESAENILFSLFFGITWDKNYPAVLLSDVKGYYPMLLLMDCLFLTTCALCSQLFPVICKFAKKVGTELYFCERD